MKGAYIWGPVALVLLTGAALKAGEQRGRIGLKDAEQIAIDNSMDLRLLQVEAAALEKSRNQKLRDFFPQASVSYRQNRVVAQRDFDNGTHSVQMQLSQPIYDGGKSQINLEIADID
ncbi:MAG: TolC family protein, partial [Spirochaetia bacterium]|nr:TolC family protein [Spirochaetia bacterium]